MFSRLSLVGLLTVFVAASGARTAHAQATISIPTNLTVAPGGTVNIPVNLTITGNSFTAANGNGLSGVAFVIAYTPLILGNVGSSFTLGTLISNPSYGFNNYTLNNTNGLIRAVSSSTTGTPALASGASGTVAIIPFTVGANAAPGAYSFTFQDLFGATSITDNAVGVPNTYSLSSNPALSYQTGTLTVTPEPTTFLLGVAAIGIAWRGYLRSLERTSRNRSSRV